MDYAVAMAKKSADEAATTKDDAAMFSSLIVLLTTLHGFSVTRNLLKQLGGEPDLAAEIANKIAVGDLSAQIELQSGDTSSLMAAMKNMVLAIQTLVNDADMLSKAAVEGRLQTCADAGKHQGEFRKIVEGVNNTLDGVIRPLSEAVEVLTLVEQGDLTHTVNGDYKGQLGDFKASVNNTIAKLSRKSLALPTSLVRAASRLSSAPLLSLLKPPPKTMMNGGKTLASSSMRSTKWSISANRTSCRRPVLVSVSRPDFINGMVKRNGSFIILLNVNRVLLVEEMVNLSKAALGDVGHGGN